MGTGSIHEIAASGADRRPIILVVDDDKHVHSFVRDTLDEMRIEADVERAFTGEDALKKLLPTPTGAQACKPDVVLLDLRMPGLDGADVLRVLRATPATATLPIIVLTGSEDPRVLSEAFRTGADAVLSKMLDVAEYREQLAANVVKYLVGKHGAEKRIDAAHTGSRPEAEAPC